MNRKTVLVIFTENYFDASLHCERVFLFDLLRKSVKQQISLILVGFLKTFYPNVQPIYVDCAI